MMSDPIVSTEGGAVHGSLSEGVARFLGIPFASAARFEAPEPAPPWRGTRSGSDYGPMSPQIPGELYLRTGAGYSEDCLSLNVWTPDPAGSRPVMVWIHGGGFRQGGGAHLLYDAAPLSARGDVVVVTLNYRLGALGFLAHPDLGANWGLLDQIAALRWVRDNIAAFGGDPDNVTIFGESAGSTSVALLTVAPPARGLFHRAIAQSGAGVATKMATSARRAEDLAAAAGVADVGALRDVPVDALLAAQAALETRNRLPFAFVPTIDGVVLDGRALAARAAGAAADIPMIFGTNVDEWRLWAPGDPRSRDLDDAGLHRRVDRILHGGADAVIDTFRRERAARGESIAANDLWFAIETDRFFRAPVIADADAHVAHQPSTFVYRFAWRSPAMRGWLGACHALEIAFVFGVQGRGELAGFTGSGRDADRVGDRMLAAWAAFAHTGDPSTADLAWPTHDPATRPTVVFDVASRLEHAPADAERAVVAAYGAEPLI
jgi:para-nitrobenzyl esterase